MSVLPPSERPPAGVPSGYIESKVSRRRFLPLESKTEKAAQRALQPTRSYPASSKHSDEKGSRRRFIPPPTGKTQEPQAERKSADRSPAGIPSGHIEGRVSRRRFLPVETKTEKAAQRALHPVHPVPRSTGLRSKHNEEKVVKRRSLPSTTGKTELRTGETSAKTTELERLKEEFDALPLLDFTVQPITKKEVIDITHSKVVKRRSLPSTTGKTELRTGETSAKTTELERLKEEFDALPLLDFTVQPITKKEVIDITHSKAKLTKPEISRDTIAGRLFFCSNFSDNDSFSCSKEGDCLEMRGICNFTPHTTSVNQTDYSLELEAPITTQYPRLLGYARGPTGHNPGPRPRNFVFGCPDFVQMTLSLVEEEPSFAENEVVCQCTYPALIIRVEGAVEKALESDLITNAYEDLATGDPIQFKLEQYANVRKECRETETQIIGKVDITQRIVHRDGELVLEKGVNGHLVECGRIHTRELVKVPRSS
jgi:hypothetical protein